MPDTGDSAPQHGTQSGAAFYLDNATLQCRAGCGFFGNPEWLGYCSMCYKQINQHQLYQQQHESQQLPIHRVDASIASQQAVWDPSARRQSHDLDSSSIARELVPQQVNEAGQQATSRPQQSQQQSWFQRFTSLTLSSQERDVIKQYYSPTNPTTASANHSSLSSVDENIISDNTASVEREQHYRLPRSASHMLTPQQHSSSAASIQRPDHYQSWQRTCQDQPKLSHAAAAPQPSASSQVQQLIDISDEPSEVDAKQPHQCTQTQSAEVGKTSVNLSNLQDFDKYGEKRRTQYTDKKSNVLKVLRRASTFKDKSASDATSTGSSSPSPTQKHASQSTLVIPHGTQVEQKQTLASTNASAADEATTTTPTHNSIATDNHRHQETDSSSVTKRPSSPTPSSSSSSILNPGNIFSTLTSPTSLVMSGYDTLTSLHSSILNTAKSTFRVSPNLVASSGQQTIASARNQSTDASSIHSASQSEYMHTSFGRRGSQAHFLYDVAWTDCLRLTNKFAKDFLTIERQSDKSINDLSDMVHNFYQTMSDRFERHFVYKGASADQIELLNDNMERILNEHMYQIISARIINEDEEHNMAVQKRIRSLNWITVEHLDIDIDFRHPIVHDLLDKAICEMIEMNSRTSSIDKLECIVQCSKTIFELLQASARQSHIDKDMMMKKKKNSQADQSPSTANTLPNLLRKTSGGDGASNDLESKQPDDEAATPTGRGSLSPVSADQFLPVLVFVVLQANPPMLPADMRYLTRFSNPRRLMSGETGYYFTNLCCALEFIEKASGASLNISEDEFKRYVNGEAVPQTKSKFSTYLCDGLRTMCSNDAALTKLKQRSEARSAELAELTEQIDVYLEINRAKLDEMQKYATNLSQRLKANLPKQFYELMAQDRELALNLLPSKLRYLIIAGAMEADDEANAIAQSTAQSDAQHAHQPESS